MVAAAAATTEAPSTDADAVAEAVAEAEAEAEAVGAAEEAARPAHAARWQMGPALRCRPCAPWRPERAALIRDAWRAGGTPRRHRGNGIHDVRATGPTTWSPAAAPRAAAAAPPRSPSATAAAAAATPAGSPYTTAAAAAARSPSAAASLSHGTLTLSHGCSLPLSAVLAASHTPFPSDSPLYTPLAAAVAAEAYLLDVAAAVAAAPEASSEHLVVGARKHSWKGARMVHVHV